MAKWGWKKFDFNKKKLIDFTTFLCKVKIDLFIFRKMVPQLFGSIDTTYYAEYNLWNVLQIFSISCKLFYML